MGIVQKLGAGVVHLAERWLRRRTVSQPLRHRDNVGPVEHADERTIRRTAEAEFGGMSSEESRRAYENGENPGGLHRGGARPRTPHHEGRLESNAGEWPEDLDRDARGESNR